MHDREARIKKLLVMAYPETGLYAGIVHLMCHPQEFSLGDKLGNAAVGWRRLRGLPV
jgi:hypothetical protein